MASAQVQRSTALYTTFSRPSPRWTSALPIPAVPEDPCQLCLPPLRPPRLPTAFLRSPLLAGPPHAAGAVVCMATVSGLAGSGIVGVFMGVHRRDDYGWGGGDTKGAAGDEVVYRDRGGVGGGGVVVEFGRVPAGFWQVFVPRGLPGDSGDLAVFRVEFLRWDQVFGFGSHLVWLVYLFWDLKVAGRMVLCTH